MYDQLKLYNGALRNVGEGALSSLSEARGPRYLLDAVWDEDPIKYCLEQGQWQFATRTVKLLASTDVEPDFGYQCAFEKPTDYCRTTGISESEFFHEPMTRYSDEAGFWFADMDTIYVKYVSDDAEYGRSYALWSQSFGMYVSAFMAGQIAHRITGSKTTREDMEKVMEKLLSSAQGKDGLNRPTTFPSRGSLVAARHGRSGFYNRERR